MKRGDFSLSCVIKEPTFKKDGEYTSDFYETPFMNGEEHALSTSIDGRWLETQVVGYIGKHFAMINTATGNSNIVFAKNMPIIFVSKYTFKEYVKDKGLENMEPQYIESNIYFNRALLITDASADDTFNYFSQRIDKFNAAAALPQEFESLLYDLDRAYFSDDGKCVNPDYYRELFSSIIFAIAHTLLNPVKEELLRDYEAKRKDSLIIHKEDTSEK